MDQQALTERLQELLFMATHRAEEFTQEKDANKGLFFPFAYGWLSDGVETVVRELKAGVYR